MGIGESRRRRMPTKVHGELSFMFMYKTVFQGDIKSIYSSKKNAFAQGKYI